MEKIKIARVLIMTVLPEREEYYSYLKDKLPEAEFILDVDKNAMHTFIRALESAENDRVVIMEDDAMLTTGFREKISKAIAERPYEVIQFFSRRKDDVLIGSRYDSGSGFLCNVCFYLPAGIAAEMLRFLKSWSVSNREEHPTGTDTSVGVFLSRTKRRYYIHVPSLVQHRIGVSQINKRRAKERTSQTFVDLWE